MFATLARLARHRWYDAGDARQAVPDGAAERLQQRVAASERQHSGEIRICIEGGLPLSYLIRLLRSRTQPREIVRQRAEMMFAKLGVWDTEHNNGVLIYLLLAERAIELVADRGIMRVVDEAVWRETANRLGTALGSGRFEHGLTEAIDGVNALLCTYFPIPDGQLDGPTNELPDEPVFR